MIIKEFGHFVRISNMILIETGEFAGRAERLKVFNIMTVSVRILSGQAASVKHKHFLCACEGLHYRHCKHVKAASKVICWAIYKTFLNTWTLMHKTKEKIGLGWKTQSGSVHHGLFNIASCYSCSRYFSWGLSVTKTVWQTIKLFRSKNSIILVLF